jgi:hypothetical protein
MVSTPTQARRAAVPELEEPRHIWIEHPDGSIARGMITALSADSGVVRLIGSASLAPGDEVTVRIAMPRSAKTLGGTARVQAVRTVDDAAVCDLRWTHSGPDRERLAAG